MSAAVALAMAPVSAETGITIAAGGDQSYYLGEEVVLSGSGSDSEYIYLFITGPGIPDSGGKLTSPHRNIVSGAPDSFNSVKTKPDKTWEYIFYTGNLGINPGQYTIFAAGKPEAKDQLNRGTFTNVSIILKKEFVSANISSSPVLKGQPFTVTGYAEGDPGAVQLWIFGDNYVFTTTVPVNSGTSYTFTGDTQISGKLADGQYYLIVQHPMQDNQSDIVVSGDWVKNLKIGNGTGALNLFRIRGAGSIQGRDAAQALVAAINDPAVDDTYTEIPFSVGNPGTPAPLAQPATTTPAPLQPQPSPLQYAPIGAIVLILGIFAWQQRQAG